MMSAHSQRLKWTQWNAVSAPRITEIQRSHTSKFHTNALRPTTTCWGSNADVQLPHLRFSTLTTDHSVHEKLRLIPINIFNCVQKINRRAALVESDKKYAYSLHQSITTQQQH